MSLTSKTTTSNKPCASCDTGTKQKEAAGVDHSSSCRLINCKVAVEKSLQEFQLQLRELRSESRFVALSGWSKFDNL